MDISNNINIMNALIHEIEKDPSSVKVLNRYYMLTSGFLFKFIKYIYLIVLSYIGYYAMIYRIENEGLTMFNMLVCILFFPSIAAGLYIAYMAWQTKIMNNSYKDTIGVFNHILNPQNMDLSNMQKAMINEEFLCLCHVLITEKAEDIIEYIRAYKNSVFLNSRKKLYLNRLSQRMIKQQTWPVYNINTAVLSSHNTKKSRIIRIPFNKNNHIPSPFELQFEKIFYPVTLVIFVATGMQVITTVQKQCWEYIGIFSNSQLPLENRKDAFYKYKKIMDNSISFSWEKNSVQFNGDNQTKIKGSLNTFLSSSTDYIKTVSLNGHIISDNSDFRSVINSKNEDKINDYIDNINFASANHVTIEYKK